MPTTPPNPLMVVIPDFQEFWRLDKDAQTATMTNDGVERVLNYTYDEAVRMIRLARAVGARVQRG